MGIQSVAEPVAVSRAIWLREQGVPSATQRLRIVLAAHLVHGTVVDALAPATKNASAQRTR